MKIIILSEGNYNEAISLLEGNGIGITGAEVPDHLMHDLWNIADLDPRHLAEESSFETNIGEDMDGDFDSGMASAGHGTDEDYGSFNNEMDF